MLVYKYQNNINGKIYVGRTTRTLAERMYEHLHNKNHSLIDEAIQEYGMENFTVSVIATCDTHEELDRLERYWIHRFDCVYPKGYNRMGYRGKSRPPANILGKRPTITATVYDKIYADLKNKIETHEYEFNSLLPSENELTKIYNCSRWTIHRAIIGLIERGYVQTRPGSRIRVIFESVGQKNFGIEFFEEAAARNGFSYETRVVRLEEIVADEEISARTGFKVGDELYDVRRVRCIEGKALILDKNYFLVSEARGLNAEIAEKSIYDYLENVLKMKILTSKRRMTAELATTEDKRWLELDDYNCLVIISGRVFNAEGIQFEYTESRHRPDYFCFEDTATRHRNKLL